MPAFGLLRPPRSIVFGRGSVTELGALVTARGTRVLVCTDPFLASSAHGTTVLGVLREAGLEVTVLDAAVPELPLADVEVAVAEAAKHRPDVIVGFGGGSSIDLAKLVALGLSDGRPLPSFYGENQIERDTLPVIAVPTTAGTGSEVTPVAVLSDPERELKVGIADPHLIPDAALCDPDLTHGAPPHVTAFAGIDALAHAIEAYTAREYDAWSEASGRVFVGRNVLSDRFALHAVVRIAPNLVAATQDDPDAREAMLEGSLCAGLAFGTGGTALAHAAQYAVGAKTKTAHGLGVGLLLPFAMSYNRDARASELAQVGAAMGADDDAGAAIDAIRALCAAIGLPASLAELGVDEDDLAVMAEQTLRSQRLINNNPVGVDLSAAERFLHAAWSGDPALIHPTTSE